MSSKYIRYGHDISDRFTINTPAGTIVFRESKYDGSDKACNAAMKAVDVLRAAGITATVESTVWGWTEQIERARA